MPDRLVGLRTTQQKENKQKEKKKKKNLQKRRENKTNTGAKIGIMAMEDTVAMVHGELTRRLKRNRGRPTTHLIYIHDAIVRCNLAGASVADLEL